MVRRPDASDLSGRIIPNNRSGGRIFRKCRAAAPCAIGEGKVISMNEVDELVVKAPPPATPAVAEQPPPLPA